MPPGYVKRWLIAPDPPQTTADARTDAERFLERLSASSGGRLVAARADADIPEVLARVGEELSSQIVLGYYPSNAAVDGTYRRIRVTAECDGCSVRARAGYRAGVAR